MRQARLLLYRINNNNRAVHINNSSSSSSSPFLKLCAGGVLDRDLLGPSNDRPPSTGPALYLPREVRGGGGGGGGGEGG